MRLARFAAVFGLCTLLSAAGRATVFVPATDADLARGADAIVIGTVTDSLSRVVNGYIKTESHLQVERVIKGDLSAGAVITIDEFGGTANGIVMYIVAEASYRPGERVLALLRHDEGSRFHTASMSRGQFTYGVDGRGRQVMARNSDGESDERPYLAAEFEQYLREVLQGREPQIQYIDTTPRATTTRLPRTNGFPASAYVMIAGGYPARIGTGPSGAVSYRFSLSGSGTTANFSGDAGAWGGIPNSSITLTTNGTNPGSSPNQFSTTGISKPTIYLGTTPSGTVCDGTSACTLIWANNSPPASGGQYNTFNGETFLSILEANILLAPGTPSDTLVMHEFGHTIGLRHSNQPNKAGDPSSGAAIMASTTNNSFGTTPQQWDKDAASTVYGSGPPCVAPSSVQILAPATVTSGQSATMSATAAGSTPMTFQWYQGSLGDTTKPLGTGSTQSTGPITAATSFWVSATNTCGTSNASITISPTPCSAPGLLVDVQSQTITSGQTVTLTIGTTGSGPFSYQWYQGTSGDTSNPIAGATSQSFTSGQLTTTTSFWVKVSNSCGSVNSGTAVITVPGTCTGPTFTTQPSGFNLTPGTISYLIARASAATSYQWYQGQPGDTSKPLNGAAPSDARWVTQVYVDILGRTPTASETTQLTSALASSNRATAATYVELSAEHRTAVLQSLFSAYLGRSASPSEVAYYIGGLQAGMIYEQIAGTILGSPEFFTLAGGTNAGWVNLVFQDVLGRAPTSSESAQYVAFLTANAPRWFLAQAVLMGQEARTRLIQGSFTAYLRRSPTSTELAGLVNNAQLTDDQVIGSILASDEYYNFPTILVVGPVTSPTSYWVAASNGTCSTNSGAATVSNPPCAAPVITNQPQSLGINLGDVPPLSVGATGNGLTYQWYSGSSGDTSHAISGATAPVLNVPAATTAGTATYWVKVSNSCASTNSNTATVVVNCAVSKPPVLATQPSASSGASYAVSWTVPASIYDHFELQESTSADFASPTTLTTTSTTYAIPAHTVSVDTRFYYRVRGFLTCGTTTPQAYSVTGTTLVNAPPPPNPPSLSISNGCIAVNGKCLVVGQFGFIGPNQPPVILPPAAGKWATPLDTTSTYTVTADEPWITFNPSSGTVASGSTVTVNYTIDATNLPNGSTNATIALNFNTTTTTTAAGKPVTLGTTTSSSSIPLSVNLVSPVSPVPKNNNPPPNTLLIPAAAHAAGANSQFVTDMRLVNTAANAVTYQMTYTPSGTDGTTIGKSFQITVNPGETKALNDLVQAWFGSGAAGEAGIGTVEIRPLNYLGKGAVKTLGTTNSGLSITTVASSRTYNVTPTGTFGQFIPAIPLGNFLATGSSKISLQQIAQSPDPTTGYRTNLGMVEGSGQPVNLELRLLDSSGNTISAIPWSLKPYEHQQGSLASYFPGVNLTDGRLEIKVLSATGNVSAYASVLDNITNDPLAVFPVQPSLVSGKMYVIPGVADLNNGAANFHTDSRIYNGGSSAVTATLTYMPQGGSASAPVTMTINPGEVKVLNDTLKSTFNVTNSGGAVVVTTPGDSSLVLTARTFSRGDNGGTFGQFIPGVTAADGVGSSDRPLQVIQLEQSPAFRTNVGLVEVTGNPVVARVKAYSPDSKVVPQIDVGLGPNEFRQLSSIFAQMGYPTVYNGRVTVEILNGNGKVAAYGSVIDNRTQDPTYVPAQ